MCLEMGKGGIMLASMVHEQVNPHFLDIFETVPLGPDDPPYLFLSCQLLGCSTGTMNPFLRIGKIHPPLPPLPVCTEMSGSRTLVVMGLLQSLCHSWRKTERASILK